MSESTRDTTLLRPLSTAAEARGAEVALETSSSYLSSMNEPRTWNRIRGGAGVVDGDDGRSRTGSGS